MVWSSDKLVWSCDKVDGHPWCGAVTRLVWSYDKLGVELRQHPLWKTLIFQYVIMVSATLSTLEYFRALTL